MANLLLYTDKSKTIDDRLRSMLASIQLKYASGEIANETAYYHAIKTMVKDFYISLNRPTYKFRPAVTTPISQEYNAMISEAYRDMEFIVNDCTTLEDLIKQSYADAELSRTMLSNEVNYLSKKIQSIGNSIETNQRDGTVIFTERFDNMEYFGNSNSTNSLTVNVNDGILSLTQTTANRIVPEVVYIDPEKSNGFPGNSHAVDTLNNELHFIGQEGIHNNVLQTIDGSTDTWFEFELFSINDETRKKCNSYGFGYEEGIEWINNKDMLRLKLVLVLKNIETCSWITVIPYLSDTKGVKCCFLEEVVVTTASNNMIKVSGYQAFEDRMVFPFPPQQIQKIELTFVQPYKYQCKVGHFYYTSSDTTSMSIYQQYDDTDWYARIDGPQKSVGLLNCKYDPKTKWIEYPDSNTEYISEEYAKQELFTKPESTIERKSSYEMIDAYRYFIGIKEISMKSSTFMSSGEYVSKEFKTEEPITSIIIEADEYIPTNDYELIKYYISLNGGTTWHKIYPIHRAYQGIYKYFVNNDSIENVLSSKRNEKKSKNLVVLGEPKTCQVKIVMNRPSASQDKDDVVLTGDAITKENLAYATPIVFEYRLKVTTGGETIEF